jgi:hypothetical protein
MPVTRGAEPLQRLHGPGWYPARTKKERRKKKERGHSYFFQYQLAMSPLAGSYFFQYQLAMSPLAGFPFSGL